MGRRRVLLAVVVLVAAAGIAVGSASGLSVAGGALTGRTGAAPCSGVSVASPAVASNATTNVYRGVSITVPSSCGSRTVQVAVQNGTGWRTGSATVNGSGIITLNNTYTAKTTTVVKATVDGWNLPVTWSFAATTCVDPTGSSSCTSAVTIFTGNKPGGGFFTYYDVTVTTTSTTPVPWQVTILMSHPDLPGVPTYLGNSTLDGFSDGVTAWSSTGNVNDVQRISPCSSSPVLVLAGEPSGPATNRWETVVAGRQRLFSIVLNYNTPQYSDLFSPGCA